jgi:phosphoribosylformylglycinamidine cyclo-ligase
MPHDETSQPLTYEAAGVSIDAQDQAIAGFKRLVDATHAHAPGEVLAGVGAFGAAFAPDLTGLRKPVLISSTDGLGTKVLLHAQAGKHEQAGRDLVGCVVNDVICCGAKPAFFLDYLGINRVEPEVVRQIVGGVAAACGEINCALIGGEIAEMRDVYKPGEYDLAGYAMGLVDQERMLGAHLVRRGDVVLGLASTGVHCNGFTLVRRALADLAPEQWDAPDPRLGSSLRDALLAVTRCYANAMAALAGHPGLHAAAHISGGGLLDNLPRVIPAGMGAVLQRAAINVPQLFAIIQSYGQIADSEMWHVFNMGIGFALIVEPGCADEILHTCQIGGFTASTIGVIDNCDNHERVVLSS